MKTSTTCARTAVSLSSDQPFNNTTTLLWEVPYGKGRRSGSNPGPVVNSFLGGWSIACIGTMTSGIPVTLVYRPNPAFTVNSFPSGDSPAYRVNLTGDPMMRADQRNIYHYFNPVTVQIPTDVSHPFGNAGRNITRGYPFYHLDLSGHKQFALSGENRRLEYRAEFFNAFNHTNFNVADGNRSDGGFGTITSAQPARQIQLALKFLF